MSRRRKASKDGKNYFPGNSTQSIGREERQVWLACKRNNVDMLSVNIGVADSEHQFRRPLDENRELLAAVGVPGHRRIYYFSKNKLRYLRKAMKWQRHSRLTHAGTSWSPVYLSLPTYVKYADWSNI